ncbi:MAG: chromophore lyase CpcT/CpeT, partial [Phycisphaerales bacterium]|nr:chromophore lyase CpcT/CpeT [Phycisphaerales bacterium]
YISRRIVLALTAVAPGVLAGCAGHATQSEARSPGDLERLAAMMTGTFSSRAQAELDEDFFDIRLVMAPIWKERGDGPWLYVEQAVATSLEQPYRQRVYHLVEVGDGSLRSEVYELPRPAAYIGAWRQDSGFEDLTATDLVLREGCAILLRPDGRGGWAGSTRDRECLSALGGATYATSEVEIGPDRLVSWDRGWDDAGTQMWGAVKSGYIFDHISPRAPR